jgi:AhpD family alkylhydroperoxidase
MPERPNPYFATPDLAKPLLDFSDRAGGDSLDPLLKELVRIRVSQINGCAICLQLHTELALRSGETRERVMLLDAWRETSLYSARERAALGWAEALTRIAARGSNDDAYRQLAAEFDVRGQVALTLVIGAINAMNQAGVGFAVGSVSPKELESLLERVPA